MSNNACTVCHGELVDISRSIFPDVAFPCPRCDGSGIEPMAEQLQEREERLDRIFDL